MKNDNIFLCIICDCVVPTELDLFEHMILIHGIKISKLVEVEKYIGTKNKVEKNV